jgi:hypothetical protein
MEQQYFSTREIAQMLGVTPAYLRKLRQLRTGPEYYPFLGPETSSILMVSRVVDSTVLALYGVMISISSPLAVLDMRA